MVAYQLVSNNLNNIAVLIPILGVKKLFSDVFTHFHICGQVFIVPEIVMYAL